MKKIILILIILIIIAGGYFVFNNYQLLPKQQEENTVEVNKNYQGQIEYVEGGVEKRISEDDGWKAVAKSDLVKQGDEIRTLSDARVIVTFEEGSVLRLDSNTVVKIKNTTDDIEVALNKGTVFNKITKSKTRKYSVASGDFKIVALGTEFSVENENNAVEVVVVESEVEIQDEGGKKIEKIETGKKAKVSKKEIKKENVSNKDKEKFVEWEKKNQNDNKKDTDNSKQFKKLPYYGAEDGYKNVPQDKKDTKIQKTVKTVPVSKISIWGKSTSQGVKINWSVKEVDVSKGFKLVKSTSKNPVYPGNDYKYFSDSSKRSYEWKITDGKGYYFRVCQYLGGKCGVYSKNLYLTTPTKITENPKEDENQNNATDLSLTVSKDDNYVILTWGDLNGAAPKGFKAVYSENSNPVYPGNTYRYLSSPDVRTTKWPLSDFQSGQTYHFRVCIYQGGGVCGAYSNDVASEL